MIKLNNKKIISVFCLLAFGGCKKEKHIKKTDHQFIKEISATPFKKEYDAGFYHLFIDAVSQNGSTNLHLYTQSSVSAYGEEKKNQYDKFFKIKGHILKSFMLDLDNDRQAELYLLTIGKNKRKKLIGFAHDYEGTKIENIHINPIEISSFKKDTITEKYGELIRTIHYSGKEISYSYHLIKGDDRFNLNPERLSENSAERKTLQAVRFFLKDNYFKDDLKSMSALDRKFNYASIDLNNDNKKETFIRPVSNYTCGSGGCNLIILNDQYKKITKMTVTQTPIIVRQKKVNNWPVLVVYSGHNFRELKYKNGNYPTNPSVAPAISYQPEKGDSIIFYEEENKNKIYSF